MTFSRSRRRRAFIFAGNALGERLAAALQRRPSSGRAQAVLEYGALVVCVALAVAGIG